MENGIADNLGLAHSDSLITGMAMTELELRVISPFDRLPMETAADGLGLRKPDDPRYNGIIYEADDPVQVRDLLTDRQLVPKGSYRDEFGKVWAVFWQLRKYAGVRC